VRILTRELVPSFRPEPCTFFGTASPKAESDRFSDTTASALYGRYAPRRLRVIILRIRIRRAIAGIIDGVSLSHLEPGLAYEVSESLGGYLVSCGDADVVPASAPIVNPDEHQRDHSVFGGIIVAPPIERDRAADRPPRNRRVRR